VKRLAHQASGSSSATATTAATAATAVKTATHGLPGNDKQVLKTLKQAQALRAVGKEIKQAGKDIETHAETVRETAREKQLQEREFEYFRRDKELRAREHAETKQLLDSMRTENDIVFGDHDAASRAEARLMGQTETDSRGNRHAQQHRSSRNDDDRRHNSKAPRPSESRHASHATQSDEV
jgi:hypothetical protein